jgi:AcrR family transcriptional regulator
MYRYVTFRRRLVVMPKLWTDTVATHRQQVRQAVLDAAGHLVARDGLWAVSMSRLAEVAGIGRATLYKYFDDVEEVLAAWHARQVSAHLTDLTAVAARPGEASARLRAVLERYAHICVQRSRHGGDVAAAMHRAPGIDDQHRQLQELMTGLIQEAASAGTVRADVPAEQLAGFCLAALTAASPATSPDVVVELVWTALTADPVSAADSA